MAVLSLSRALIQGTVRLSDEGEPTHAILQVGDLDLLGGTSPIQVQIAGPILVESVETARVLDLAKYLDSYHMRRPFDFKAQVLKVQDVSLHKHLPRKIPVVGILRVDADKVLDVSFKGTFHPTGYLREAWGAKDDISAPSGRRRYF